MTDEDGAAIDPRYDRAFQRGFAGEVATGPRGQSTLRRTAAVNPAPARPATNPVDDPRAGDSRIEVPAFSPAPQALALDSVSIFAPGDASAVPMPVASAAVPGVVGPRELARNPFMMALAVLGAVLIVAGAVWAYEGFAAIIKNGGTRNEVEFWAAQTMSFGAPLAIGLGLAVAAVLLALFGRAWQRARR